MTTKKQRPQRKSPGVKSAKREGIVAQTIRIDAKENRRLHRIAKSAKQSFNSWAVDTLTHAANIAVFKTKLERENKKEVAK